MAVIITVTSNTDRDAVSVALDVSPGTIIDEAASNDGQTWEGQFGVGWNVNVKANQTIVLTRKIHTLEKEGSIHLVAMVTYDSGKQVTTGTYVQLIHGTLIPSDSSQQFLNNGPDGEATWTMLPPAPTLILLETFTPAPTFTVIWAPTNTLAPTETPTRTPAAYPPPAEATPDLQEDRSSAPPDSGGTAYPAP
jgi:hypothetical protein